MSKPDIPPQPPPAKPDCPICHGSGFESRDVMTATLDGPVPVAFSAPCECRKAVQA